MSTVFLDSNVFLYAAGADHPLRKPSQDVLRRVVAGELLATTSVEVVQEFLHVLIRRGLRDTAFALAQNTLDLFPDLLPVTRHDMVAAGRLLETYPQLKVRDAVHAATMLNNGVQSIVSADQHFHGIAGLRWVRLTEL